MERKSDTRIMAEIDALRKQATANITDELKGRDQNNKLRLGKGKRVYLKETSSGVIYPIIEKGKESIDVASLELSAILNLHEVIKCALETENMKDGKPCYTVLYSVCCEGDENTFATLGTFSDKERARKVLKAKRDEYIQLIETDSLWIYPDTEPCKDDFEDTQDCFHIWKDGYYSTDHVLIQVVESHYHKS